MNQLEDWDNWDEDIPENTSISFPVSQDNHLPRLSTTDWQISQIGYQLGRYRRSTTHILNKLAQYNESVAFATNARDIAENNGDYERAQEYEDQRLEARRECKIWKKRARARLKEQQTGVTRIKIHNL